MYTNDSESLTYDLRSENSRRNINTLFMQHPLQHIKRQKLQHQYLSLATYFKPRKINRYSHSITFFPVTLSATKKTWPAGVRPPPRHCLRGRMIFSQQAKKTTEPLPHPYRGAVALWVRPGSTVLWTWGMRGVFFTRRRKFVPIRDQTHNLRGAAGLPELTGPTSFDCDLVQNEFFFKTGGSMSLG